MHDYIVEGFPPVLEIPSLKHLVITKSLGIDSIPDSIKNLKNLETFVYSENGYKGFTNKKGEKVHKTMEEYLAQEDSTELSNNIVKLDGYYWPVNAPDDPIHYVTNQTTLSYLSPNIGELKNLTFFHISNVKLKALPESIGNLTSLKHFGAEFSHLKTLPKSFGKLNPAVLSLEGNDFEKLPRVSPKGKYAHANLANNLRLTDGHKYQFLGLHQQSETNSDYTLNKQSFNPKIKKKVLQAGFRYLEYKLYGENKAFVKQNKLDQ